MSIKLYEFSFLDKYSTSEGDIMRSVEQDLVAQAEIQGWAPNYSIRKNSNEIRHTDNSLEYFFTVYGELISSLDETQTEIISPKNAQPDEDMAAKPAEL